MSENPLNKDSRLELDNPIQKDDNTLQSLQSMESIALKPQEPTPIQPQNENLSKYETNLTSKQGLQNLGYDVLDLLGLSDFNQGASERRRDLDISLREKARAGVKYEDLDEQELWRLEGKKGSELSRYTYEKIQKDQALIEKINNKGKEALSTEDKAYINKRVNPFISLFTDYTDEDLQDFIDQDTALSITKDVQAKLAFLDNIHTHKSIANMLTGSSDEERDDYLKAVDTIAKSVGFKGIAYDKNDVYFYDDDKLYKPDQSFFNNFKNILAANAGSIGGGITGGIAGFKKAKTPQQALIYSSLGAALGSSIGASSDVLITNAWLNRENNFKELLHHALEEGALSIVGDVAILGAGKAIKEGIKAFKNNAVFDNLKDITGKAIDYTPLLGFIKRAQDGNKAAAQKLLNTTMNQEQREALNDFYAHFGGDLNIDAHTQSALFENIRAKFGEESYITKGARLLNDSFMLKDQVAFQKNLIQAIRADESGNLLAFLTESANANPVMQQNLKHILNKTTFNLKKQLDNIGLKQDDIRGIFNELEQGTKNSYKEAMEQVLGKVYDDSYKVNLNELKAQAAKNAPDSLKALAHQPESAVLSQSGGATLTPPTILKTDNADYNAKELRDNLIKELEPSFKIDILNQNTNLSGVITRKEADKISSDKAVQKSVANGFTKAEHFKVAEHIKELFEKAKLVEKHKDYKERPNVSAVYRFEMPLQINNKEGMAKITLFEKIEGKNKIYTIELDEISKADIIHSFIPQDSKLRSGLSKSIIPNFHNQSFELLDKSKPLRMARAEELSDELLEKAKRHNAKLWVDILENKEIAEALGMDTAKPIKITMQGDSLRHIEQRHGADSALAKNGQKAITSSEIKTHSDIVKNADIQGITTSKDGQKILVSGKQINGHYIVVESISTKHNELKLKTMYFENGKLENSKAIQNIERLLSLSQNKPRNPLVQRPSIHLDNFHPSTSKDSTIEIPQFHNKSFESFKKELAEAGIAPETSANFLNFVESTIYNPKGVSFNQLNNALKTLNSYYKEAKDPNFKDYIKRALDNFLRDDIKAGIDAIFAQNKSLYKDAQALFATALSDYANMKEVIKNVDKIKLRDRAVSYQKAMDNLLKFVKGQGKEDISNLEFLIKSLDSQNRAKVELTLLNDLFSKSLLDLKDLQVFDSGAFFKSLESLQGFQTKEAKEFIEIAKGFDTLFKNDVLIAQSLQNATTEKIGSSIATTISGAVKFQMVKMAFENIVRLMPHIPFMKGLNQKIQGSAMRFHIKSALNKSLDVNDFKHTLEYRAKSGNFTNETRNLIEKITKGIDSAQDEIIAGVERSAIREGKRAELAEYLQNYIGKDIINQSTGMNAQISQTSIKKMSSDKAVQKSVANGFSDSQHFSAAQNIAELYQKAELKATRGDVKHNDPVIKIHEFVTPLNDNAQANILVKESVDKDARRIYTIELESVSSLNPSYRVRELDTQQSKSLNVSDKPHAPLESLTHYGDHKPNLPETIAADEILPQEITKAQEQWLKTFNLKSLDEDFIPIHTPEVREVLDKAGIGEIHLKAGSLVKLVERERLEFLPFIKETLEKPDVILSHLDSVIFVKDIGKESLFTSVSKAENGEFIVRTNSFKTLSNLNNKLQDGEVLYISKEAPDILAEAFTAKTFPNELTNAVGSGIEPHIERQASINASLQNDSTAKIFNMQDIKLDDLSDFIHYAKLAGIEFESEREARLAHKMVLERKGDIEC